MELNERLRKLGEDSFLTPREDKIRQTLELCKELCFRQEKNRKITCWEFLWTQLQYTRKRWWGLQASLLLLAVQLIPEMENNYRIRSFGVIGCLFVVLMIPELWRNKESDSIQVEASCLYSLRQIYAARITLFGIVDIAMLTLFTLSLGNMGFTFMEVLPQFLLPVTVTACICFTFLCGKQNWNETVSLTACLFFGAVWWLLLMNERIYAMVVPVIWVALFGVSLIFLALAVRRTIKTTNLCWEVAYFGITTG